MAYIKCPGCGKKIQQNSSSCIYCKFDFNDLENNSNIKIIVQQPNQISGSQSVALFNKDTGYHIADVNFGETFNMQISEPITIEAKKTAWKTGSITLYAKPHATYQIIFKNGLFSSKIVIKDITKTIQLEENK